MKHLFILSLFMFGSVAFGETNSCDGGPGTNYVDLCKSDPGNRLNRTDYSETELSRRVLGSCQYQHGPDKMPGLRVVADIQIKYFDVCRNGWNAFTTKRRFCARI